MFLATYKRPGKTIFVFFCIDIFIVKKSKLKKIELQACYVPQMKAENMHNSYLGIRNRIFKEKFFFFEIFDFSKILKKFIFVKNFKIFGKISKMASPGLF